ncbi:hypothetical protein MMC13_006606 [Lambiella insularis]|nr:hypothetical protein [Lambiella insularis]
MLLPTAPKTALLIIDMQVLFTTMVPSALPHIHALHTFFTSTSRPIIFTQHGHPPSDLEPPFKNQLVRRWGVANSIRLGSPDWQFLPSIKKLVQASPVVAKNTYDAFVNTNLAALLEEAGVERVVICGVMTDCCCETTARSCFNRGWETWFVSDAMGSATVEQHERAVKDYGFGYGPVLETEEVLGRLRKEG